MEEGEGRRECEIGRKERQEWGAERLVGGWGLIQTIAFVVCEGARQGMGWRRDVRVNGIRQRTILAITTLWTFCNNALHKIQTDVGKRYPYMQREEDRTQEKGVMAEVYAASLLLRG